MLTNVGNATAYDVQMDTGDMHVVRGDLSSDEVRPEGFIKFMASRHMGMRDDTIAVRSKDEAGSPNEWARPLPPRPPR